MSWFDVLIGAEAAAAALRCIKLSVECGAEAADARVEGADDFEGLPPSIEFIRNDPFRLEKKAGLVAAAAAAAATAAWEAVAELAPVAAAPAGEPPKAATATAAYWKTKNTNIAI